MTAERLKKPIQPEVFPTAGYGSVAPPWIKADLVSPSALNSLKVTEKPPTPHLDWLRRQLGWHQS